MIRLARATAVFAFLFSVCFIASVLAEETKSNDTSKSTSRPNILIFLCDDMGWADIGCYGSEIPTPNIDALAKGGVRFTQFYNTARCSPTRASLMTGLYPHQAGMGHLDGTVHEGTKGTQGKLRDDCVTMAEVLDDAGYYTAMAGKWHLGQQHGTPPWKRGFEHELNSPFGGIYFPNQKARPNLFLNGKNYQKDDPIFGDNWYSVDLWTDWGLKFADEAIDKKQPFFLYVAQCAPHFPLMAQEKTIEKYRGKYMIGWDKLREARHQRQIEMGLVDPAWPLSARPDEVSAWDKLSDDDKKRFDDMMSIYAAMIDRIDANVGKLVKHLDEKGVLDNTLILFLSDNGGNAESGPNGRYEGKHPGGPNSTVYLGQSWATLANTPFRRYKHFTHEGGISTPLIAHWPDGIPADRDGKLEKQPGHVVDLMPTVVELAGAKYPTEYKGHQIQPMEGTSIVPAFSGKPLDRKNPIFFAHEGNRGIRDGKWKLVMKYKGPWELYDIEADRTEQHDLSKEKPELAKKLSDEWDAWAARSDVDPWSGPARNNSGGIAKGNGGEEKNE
ncbi:MAG TPA: arylsulfatase [Lacipirellulaceae bacterium]|nr:arylsulfatase [Lacipirellulaceae bacterium]